VLGYRGIEGFSGELSREIAAMPEEDIQPEDTQPEDIQPDVTEVLTLGFEWMKQLTTLSAGSIVVIGTFLSNIFPTDNQGTLTMPLGIKLLIGLAFVGFGVSLIVSAKAMDTYRGILERFLRRERPEEIYSRATKITISLPLLFFTVGVICFGLAVLLNMIL
jgi:hypothetical protein